MSVVLALVLQSDGIEDAGFHTCLVSVPIPLQLPSVALLPFSRAA